PGTLTVNGNGILHATGKVLALGPVTVNTGGALSTDSTMEIQDTLTANGNVSASSLLIGPQATLAGDLGVVVADTTVQGRIAPSGQEGAPAFEGSLRFESTSVLDLDIQPHGGDSIAVSGPVTIAPGARIVFRTDPTAYTTAAASPILETESTITG